MRRRCAAAVAGLSISCPLQTSIWTVTTTPHLTSRLSKMGERLPGQKSYVCSFFDCKAKFSKSWKLEAHLCKHTGLVRAFARSFKRSGYKWRHRYGQIIKFICFCLVFFPYMFLSPQKPFSCESCDRSFCTRYQLTRHELNHSGEKPHKYVIAR